MMAETGLSKFHGKIGWLKLDDYTEVEIGVFASICLVSKEASLMLALPRHYPGQPVANLVLNWC